MTAYRHLFVVDRFQVLTKPFTPAQLLAKVKEALSSAHDGSVKGAPEPSSSTSDSQDPRSRSAQQRRLEWWRRRESNYAGVLSARKLLILQNGRNAKNDTSAGSRYTASARALSGVVLAIGYTIGLAPALY